MNLVKQNGYKKKTIEKIIMMKINHWLKSIDDNELKQGIKQNIIVTGGCIASMLQGEKPNDFDFYFKDSKFLTKLAEYYVKKIPVKNDKIGDIEVKDNDNRVSIFIRSAGVIGEKTDTVNYNYFELLPSNSLKEYMLSSEKSVKKNYIPLYITENSISLSGNIQIITRFVGDPEEIHKNFDYVHVTNYFTYETGLVYNQKALEAIITKELKYVGSLFPVCSLFRLRKFLKRGWRISAGEILKISWDVSKLDLNDRNVLKEQLIGCDVHYFKQLIDILKDNENIERSYLVEIIDKIFDENDDLNVDMDDDQLAEIANIDN